MLPNIVRRYLRTKVQQGRCAYGNQSDSELQAGSDKYIYTLNHLVAPPHISDKKLDIVNKTEQPLSSSDHRQRSQLSSPSVLDVGLDLLLQ